jgi:hypothetical protein
MFKKYEQSTKVNIYTQKYMNTTNKRRNKMEKRIKFQGQDFFLIGETEGAIATKDQYENGLCSYAYLMPSGEILRFGTQIGTIKDIEFLGDAELNPTKDALVNVLAGFLEPDKWGKEELSRG